MAYKSAVGHYYILGGVSYGPFKTKTARNADRKKRQARKKRTNPRRRPAAKKRAPSKRRSTPRRKNKSFTKRKHFEVSRKLRKARRSGDSAKLAYHKKRAYARLVGALAKDDRVKNPAPRKAKFNTWYTGPKGTRVRVRRVRGKLVVDVKK